VWVDHDGECARFNTTLERQKGRNLLNSRRVSLLVVDPESTVRSLQVSGEVELITAGAVAHVDELTRKYTRHPGFYGWIYPVEQRTHETRVIFAIHTRRVTLHALHI